MYYFLKIKDKTKGKPAADSWIGKRGFAPFFYGIATLEELNDPSTAMKLIGKQRYPSSVQLFLKAFCYGSKTINDQDYIVSIGNGTVYVYRQKEPLRDYGQDLGDHIRYNGFDITDLKKYSTATVPLVLATIESNKHTTTNTFTKINPQSHFGSCRALDYLLTKNKPQIQNFAQYLQCLSSIQFETLIAKVYEENGYFVPAYRGGNLRRYDLFCRKGNKTIVLQLKTKLVKDTYEQSEAENTADIDYYYCIDADPGIQTAKIKDASAIEKELTSCPKTTEWLRQALNWVTLTS